LSGDGHCSQTLMACGRYRFLMNTMDKKKSYRWILVLLLGSFMLSSCGVFRDAPRRHRMSAEETRVYSQRLGMPLTGRENATLVREVSSWMGVPFRLGGSTRSGADCSGFIWAVYREVYNESLPRTTEEMADETRRIRRRNLREGDLVFFRMQRRKLSHAGIYLGNGYFAHATTSRGVMVNSLDEPYYRRRFARGGRVR